ncbi:MAG TPA: LysE family translocator [Streptosporangiaceae bacterium]|nr:LysE family translocator [Streptosporangiaceae bacterium]
MTPGPDTVVTIGGTLSGGRRGGVLTALGVFCGQAVWTLATSAGISALLVASAPAFLTVKYVGAAYLVFLGIQALWSAASHRQASEHKPSDPPPANCPPPAIGPSQASASLPSSGPRPAIGPSPASGPPPASSPPLLPSSWGHFRRGLLSDLSNPKMAVFFTGLLPQFGSSFAALVLLGLLFCTMTFGWLYCCSLAVARMGDLLRRSRIRRALDAVTGAVLVAFGLRIAIERS